MSSDPKKFKIEFTERKLGYVTVEASSKEEARSIFEVKPIGCFMVVYTDSEADIDSVAELDNV